MIAPRVGEEIANAPDCTATSASSRPTLFRCSTAWSRSKPVHAQVTADEMSSSVRRSTASATEPPQSPKMTSGTRPATPSMPTQNEDLVIA